MSEKKPKYLIYYNNGHLEIVDRHNVIYFHQVELGIIKYIVNLEEYTVESRSQDGSVVTTKISQVNGL